MDWKPLLALIDAGLAAKGWKDNRASNEAGHPDAIRNMRRKARGDLKGGVNFDTVFDVAKALEISPLAVCKVAMGYSPNADDVEIIRQQVKNEIVARLEAEPARPARKRRISSR